MFKIMDFISFHLDLNKEFDSNFKFNSAAIMNFIQYWDFNLKFINLANFVLNFNFENLLLNHYFILK